MSGWFRDTITKAAISSVNNYGQPTYGSNVSVSARVEDVRTLVKDIQGNEVQSSHKIATDTAINWDDKIWLPDENPSTDQPHNIINIFKASTKPGDYTLYEVYL